MLPIDAPDVDDEGKPTGTTHHVARDEGLRETSLEALAKLKPVARENGVHTAGIVVADHRRRRGGAADDRGPGARSSGCGRGRASSTSASSVSTRCSCSPARSTRRAACSSAPASTIDDIDVIEINEAFASVVLAWERELKPDMAKVNPNGGAIALGHPVGATGARLVTTALHELERTDGAARAHHDVLRRRARHRHDHRTRLNR